MRRPVVRRKILGVIGALALAALPIGASAHHSSATFDVSRALTLHGVVREFRWTNPHAFIQVLVESDRGQVEEWSIEMGGLDHLARAGWRPGTLTGGDAVSLVVHPMRDGTKGGLYVSGIGPRGALIAEQPPAPISTQILSPVGGRTSCPRVDLTLVEQSASSETRAVKLGEQTLFVRRDAITTTGDISEIKVAGDDSDTLIQIKYRPDAAAKVLEATTDHDGVKLAFVVDDEVWLSFTWRGPYGIGPEGTQLSLQHGMAKARRLTESIGRCTDAQVR